MIKEELERLNWNIKTIRRARVEYVVPRVWVYYDLMQRDTGDLLRLPYRPSYPKTADITFAGPPLRFNWGIMGDGYIGEKA